jgi:predicted house-cleaning noncanonical NTP pyrophosphatase (MazG superfamily)
MRTTYDKLVRDRVTARLDENGVAYGTRRAEPNELGQLLMCKLREEIEELGSAAVASEVAEEIVDIVEVAYAIAEAHGVTEEDIAQRRNEKRRERGAFADGVVLLWTEAPDTTSLAASEAPPRATTK